MTSKLQKDFSFLFFLEFFFLTWFIIALPIEPKMTAHMCHTKRMVKKAMDSYFHPIDMKKSLDLNLGYFRKKPKFLEELASQLKKNHLEKLCLPGIILGDFNIDSARHRLFMST